MGASRRISRTRVAKRRRRLVVAGLVAFAAVDVLLVAAALGRDGSGDSGAAADRVPVAVTTPPDTTTGTREATPTPTATPTTVVAPARLLSAVDARTAWRATRGACPAGEQPVLERTDDGGATWRPVSLGADAPAALDRVQAQDAATLFVVGATAGDCEPVFAQTFSGGGAFRTYPDRLAASWYVSATDAATVHSPAGTFPAPCAVVTSLAVTDDARAAVLCADGQLRATVDAAATWGTPVPVPGVTDLTATADGYLLVGLDDDCDGVAVSSWSASGGAVTDVGCASGPAPAKPDQLAIAARGGSAWLWSGDDVLVSTDGGATW